MKVLRFGALAVSTGAFVAGCSGYVPPSQISSVTPSSAGSSLASQTKTAASAFIRCSTSFACRLKGRTHMRPSLPTQPGNFGETNQGWLSHVRRRMRYGFRAQGVGSGLHGKHPSPLS